MFVFIVSCTKEESTNYNTNLKNISTHNIIIRPFANGQIVSSNIITLTPNMSIEIANGSLRGLNGNSGFSSKYFENVDSMRVTFDNMYTITHYGKTPVNFNNKYYLYTSNRNILNYLSYKFDSKILAKTQWQNTYNFEFIEQDYLDARQ